MESVYIHFLIKWWLKSRKILHNSEIK